MLNRSLIELPSCIHGLDTFEPSHEKTNNAGLRPGPTQTSLYSHRSRRKASDFRFKKKKDCSACVAKTKALISFAVTSKLVCAFVFAYANCWFSDAVVHLLYSTG